MCDFSPDNMWIQGGISIDILLHRKLIWKCHIEQLFIEQLPVYGTQPTFPQTVNCVDNTGAYPVLHRKSIRSHTAKVSGLNQESILVNTVSRLRKCRLGTREYPVKCTNGDVLKFSIQVNSRWQHSFPFKKMPVIT